MVKTSPSGTVHSPFGIGIKEFKQGVEDIVQGARNCLHYLN